MYIIKPNEIHIWSMRTDLPDGDPTHMASIVSDDEKARADRFYFPRDQRRFIMVHGMLRTILGGYLDRRPAGLKFSTSPKGKPRLDDAGAELCFNLSHSRNLAVFGIALNRQVGVDVEHIRPLSNTVSIAGHYFSESERNAILDGPPSERDRMFFLYWTIKEAYLKATGEGLSGFKKVRIPPDVIDAHPDNPLLIADDSNQSWTICPIHTASGYATAFAIEGNGAVKPIFKNAATDTQMTAPQAMPARGMTGPVGDPPEKPAGSSLKVMLVDDHAVMRQGLSMLLSSYDDIQIAGEASDGKEAVKLAREINPDIILMDINMPEMNGIEATRIINAELPHIRIIGLSMYDPADQADEIRRAGARQYLKKHGDKHELLNTIRDASVNACW